MREGSRAASPVRQAPGGRRLGCWRRLAPALALAWIGATLCAAPALAQPAGDSAKDAARAHGEAGIALFDAGDYAGALSEFDRALVLVRVPTLAVRSARCLEKLGRLVQASERYLLATTLPIDATLPAPFQEGQRQAQNEAVDARAALLARIPTLEIAVSGAVAEEVSLDGEPLPERALGVRLPVDPGAHVATARRGGTEARQEVTVSERSAVKLTLVLAPTSGDPRRGRGETTASSPARPPDASSSEKTGPAAVERGRELRTVGWTGVGVGATGVVAGVVTTTLALGMTNDIDRRCPGRVCDLSKIGEAGQADLATYNALKTASFASFIVGGVILAGAVVTLWTAPGGKPDRLPRKVALRGGAGLWVEGELGR